MRNDFGNQPSSALTLNICYKIVHCALAIIAGFLDAQNLSKLDQGFFFSDEFLRWTCLYKLHRLDFQRKKSFYRGNASRPGS